MATRREFLSSSLHYTLGVATAGVLGGFFPHRQTPAVGPVSPVVPGDLSHGTLSGLLNTPFRFRTTCGQILHVELIEVSDERVQIAGSSRVSQFTLLFQGPESLACRQQTCQVEHAQLGKFPLFVVPMSKPKKGQYYEAVFNRIEDQVRAHAA